MAEPARRKVFDCADVELRAFAALCDALKGDLAVDKEEGVAFGLNSKDFWPMYWPSITDCLYGKPTLFEFAKRNGVGPDWLRQMCGASPEEILVRLAAFGFSV